MKTSARVGIAIVLSAIAPLGNTAEEHTGSEPLRLEQAIVRVLENSPLLEAADFESQAAAARIRQAGLTTPWSVNIEFENLMGSGAFKGLGGMDTTLSFVRVMELGEKPVHRQELAEQQAVMLQNTQDAQRLDLLAETTRRFIDVVSAQALMDIAQDAVTLSEKALETVERRVDAGRSASAEKRRASISLANLNLELEHAHHELDVARQRLAVLWGDVRPGYGHAQANLFALNPVVEFETIESLIENNPDLIVLATEQRILEAEMALARSREKPNLELEGGIRHLGIPNDTALVLSARIPLGSTRRAAHQIEAARQSSLASELRYQQDKLLLQSALFKAYQELKHAQTAVEVLGGDIIPEAQQALTEYEEGYALGRYSLLELNAAQFELLKARTEQLNAATNFHRSQIEIERLTGASMIPGATP